MRSIFVAAILALGLQACGTSSPALVGAATAGQQLMDLKKALDAGAITSQEYERQRQQILNP